MPLRPDLHGSSAGRGNGSASSRTNEDLAAAEGMGVQRRGLETLRAGDVLVMEARGESSAGTIGDISALRAVMLGASGIVTDGPIRDGEVIAAMNVPVYAAGRHPSAPSRRHVPWEMDGAIACAGVLIEAGDILVGDADGLLVVPPAVADEVAEGALSQEREEGYVAARVAEGESLDGLFPMGAAWRERYEAWCVANPE